MTSQDKKFLIGIGICALIDIVAIVMLCIFTNIIIRIVILIIVALSAGYSYKLLEEIK